MKKSGLADSPFFSVPPMKETLIPLSDKPVVERKNKKDLKKPEKEAAIIKPGNHDTATPRYHDTTVSRYHDAIIELVRKAVKELGKEAATHRFTQEEKIAIAEIIFTYKNRGVRTSENEIARIAVNFIIQDYKENGEESFLNKALRALNE